MRVKPNENSAKLYTLKQTELPAGFILIQDTREQRPLFARLPSGLTVQSKALQNGDYSIVGHEHEFAIERKNINDLFPYCGSERPKTKAKMERFLEMSRSGGWAGLCIEEKEGNCYQYQQFSRIHPEVIRGAIISFSIRYHVHVYFAGNRENAGRWILDHAVKFYRIRHEL